MSQTASAQIIPLMPISHPAELSFVNAINLLHAATALSIHDGRLGGAALGLARLQASSIPNGPGNSGRRIRKIRDRQVLDLQCLFAVAMALSPAVPDIGLAGAAFPPTLDNADDSA